MALNTKIMALTEQQAIKGPHAKMTSVKPFKQVNQWSNQYKSREMRNTKSYGPHQQPLNIRFLT